MAQALIVDDHGPTQHRAPSSADERHSRTTLVVEGMHCGNCMRTVESALQALPGVESARVNLSARRVTIHVAGPAPNADVFVAALAQKGFVGSPLIERHMPAVDHSAQDNLKRLGVAGFAAANVMLLSVAVWSGYTTEMPASLQKLFHWLSALIALPAVAYAGLPFFTSAREALAHGRLNMDVPISLGVTLAVAMSLFQTIRGSEQVYFDAAITLLFFLLVGRTLDQAMRQRAASAAENLLGRRVGMASVIGAEGILTRVPVGDVRPGMVLSVPAGEQIPVDGRVVRGLGSVDDSIITGESLPRAVEQGALVYGGAVALSGPLEIEATAEAENSLLADIARLMHTAEQARGRYVRLADRAARFYAPAVHVLGALTFIGWMVLGSGWEPALTAAIAVLIITCPCALALAVPAVQVVATSRLFRDGTVVKTADALERLAEVDTIVLDKTGTLTRGRPELSDDAVIDDATLTQAAGLALTSRHPYAQAVVRAAQRRGLAVRRSDDVREVPGGGLEAFRNGQRTALGSVAFCGVPSQSQTVSLWFCEGTRKPVALPMSDSLRADAVDVVASLQARGYRVELLSGDVTDAVSQAARAVGISSWRAAQSPAQKIARLAALTAEGRRVLMVGDGLNDAPALAAGHASVSPSSAVDISQMAADAVFQGDRLRPVMTALEVALASRRRSLENFAIAIGYNLLFVPLAMAGRVTPLLAAIAMSASSIAVTANALRVARRSSEVRS